MHHSLFRFFLLCLTLTAGAVAHGQISVLGAYAGGENDPAFVNHGRVDSGFDSSGNGKHLTNVGNTLWSTDSAPGASDFANGTGLPSSRSYYFDGSSGLSINSPLSEDSANWGMEAWVKLDTTAGTQSIMLNGAGGDGYGLIVYNGNWNGLLGGLAFVVGPTASAGVWTHLAFVNDSGNSTFYVNGTAVAFNAATPGTPTTGFILGSDFANNYMTGYIDQARVFTFTGTFDPSQLNLTAIPEPSTYALLAGATALGLALVRRRKTA